MRKTHKMNPFPIWHLANAAYNPVRLYKSDESHYIVTQDGEWTPMLACGIYVVINQPLLSFFQQHLDTLLPSHAVSIYDRVLDKYFEGYHHIYVKDKIAPETLDKVDYAGIKIWCHESSGGIFISNSLKNALEQSDIKEVETYPGFSRYGGNI